MFRNRIRQQYDRLGRNQKRIADFLTNEYRDRQLLLKMTYLFSF